MTKKLISIVTPCYNEETNLHWYYEQVLNAIKPLEEKYNFEIVITDNCSSDRSWEIINELAQKDNRIRAFRFSRNFGYLKSIMTLYRKTKGHASFFVHCDLQDPIELLPQFVNKWEEGYKIVYGARNKRQEEYSFILHFVKRCFYYLFDKMSLDAIPHDSGDYCFIDRKVINYLITAKTKTPYIRGIIFSSGYKFIPILYDRKIRHKGNSKFNFFKLLNVSIDAFATQTTSPLRLIGIFGFVTTFLLTILSIFLVLNKLIFNFVNIPAGLTTIILLVLFCISLNAIFLGIIGEYVGRIYQHLITPDELTIIEDSIDNS